VEGDVFHSASRHTMESVLKGSILYEEISIPRFQGQAAVSGYLYVVLPHLILERKLFSTQPEKAAETFGKSNMDSLAAEQGVTFRLTLLLEPV